MRFEVNHKNANLLVVCDQIPSLHGGTATVPTSTLFDQRKFIMTRQILALFEKKFIFVIYVLPGSTRSTRVDYNKYWYFVEDMDRSVTFLCQCFKKIFHTLQVENAMKKKGHAFMRHDRLGYMCTCPTNLGTVVRCSAHIQLKVGEISKGHDKDTPLLDPTVFVFMQFPRPAPLWLVPSPVW